MKLSGCCGGTASCWWISAAATRFHFPPSSFETSGSTGGGLNMESGHGNPVAGPKDLALILTTNWQILRMECRRGEFWVSDDIKNLPIYDVVALHREVYGSDAHSEDTVGGLLHTSFWLGLYKKTDLIGFVRAVTDKSTFCYICDFIIISEFRGQGLGSWLMNCFLEHPDVQKTSMGLGTQDADSFFEKFDFERVSTMRRLSRP